MRVSYNWLKDYLPIEISAEELAQKMTFAGLEIDEVENRCQQLSGIVAGKVKTCEPVAGSDHLHLCTVFDGNTDLTIVCGAPNVAAGQTVALAKIGATLPGDFTIGRKKTMGIESEGMLCSEKELGVSEEHSGIWILPDDLAAGTDVATALRLQDQVLVLDLTPNRSDCLGVLNCAREAAALTGLAATAPDLSYPEDGPEIGDMIDIAVADSAICCRYLARLVTGIKIGPSPLWMQQYLLAAGMRPINNVVDIANFVMLEYNQPLHTFDYQALRGKKILVREAALGEELITLDGKNRVFTGDEILICDGEGPVCLGGVMGGFNSEVTESTTDILIESACFDPVHIRHTSRKLGIPSEASMRFEKGIDVASCDLAARRAAQLLVRYCGGTAAKGAVDVCDQKFADKQILLRREKVNGLLGVDYTMEEINGKMTALDFGVQEAAKDVSIITVPSYRRDITLEVDLIEEVARLMGYSNIAATIPMNQTQGYRTREQKLQLRLKELCAEHGLFETVNYSFISPKEATRLRLTENDPWSTGLTISNPLNEEQSVMRQTLLPGLLHTIGRNNSRRNLDLRLFELGNIFVPRFSQPNGLQPEEQPEPQQPTEILTLGITVSGASQADWLGKPIEYDFFYLKGILESIFASLGISGIRFSRTVKPYLHPGRTAAILLNDTEIGVIGEVHPLTAAAYEAENRIICAELQAEPLFAAAKIVPQQHELPRYPAVNRDIALIGSDQVPATAIEAAIIEAGGEHLTKAELFDIYAGAPIPAGQRSLAYALTFINEQRTLTDKEIDQAFAAIVKNLNDKLNIKLR